jgi:hypothetical protein
VSLLYLFFALASFTHFTNQAAAVEPIQCVANFQARSTNTRPAPGSLATRKDTPCRLSGYMGVFGKGTHQANGFLVRTPPKNGTVTIENASSFIFTPRKGFVGEDLLVIRMKFVHAHGAAVRFAIRVDE